MPPMEEARTAPANFFFTLLGVLAVLFVALSLRHRTIGLYTFKGLLEIAL